MKERKKRRIGLSILTGILICGNVVSATEMSEDKITIRMMHYWGNTDTDVSARCLKEILENEFEEAFPNVELVQDIYDNATYKTKIKIAMAADEEPDIMMGYGGGFSEAFVNAGKVLPLDEYLSDFYREHMNMEMQENYIYDGKQYGVCYAYWVGILYCNKTLFEQIDAEIPETYQELMSVCRKFRKAGIEPIALGMLDQWHGQQWVNNFSIQLGGADFYKKMVRGEVSLKNDVLMEAAQLTSDLVYAEAFYSDMYRTLSSEAEEMFLDGKAAMIYIGSWYTDSAEERLGEDLIVTKMPEVPGALEIEDYHGGASNGWMVASNTEYPELCVEIAAWLGYQLSCYQPENATFIIEEEDCKGEISPVAQDILELYEGKSEGAVAWDTLLKTDETKIWLDTCSRLFEKKVDGQGFAQILDNQIGQGGV